MDAERFVRSGRPIQNSIVIRSAQGTGHLFARFVSGTMGVFGYFFTLLKKVTRTQAKRCETTLNELMTVQKTETELFFPFFSLLEDR